MFELYFKNSFVSIYFDKANRLGKAVWRGHLSGAEFKETALLCQDLMDRYELKGWLGDNRKMDAIEPADLKWSMEVLLPQLIAGSILRMANLPSEHEENRKALEVMIEKKNELDQKLLIRDFETEAEAMAWLWELVEEKSPPIGSESKGKTS